MQALIYLEQMLTNTSKKNLTKSFNNLQKSKCKHVDEKNFWECRLKENSPQLTAPPRPHHVLKKRKEEREKRKEKPLGSGLAWMQAGEVTSPAGEAQGPAHTLPLYLSYGTTALK